MGGADSPSGFFLYFFIKFNEVEHIISISATYLRRHIEFSGDITRELVSLPQRHIHCHRFLIGFKTTYLRQTKNVISPREDMTFQAI